MIYPETNNDDDDDNNTHNLIIHDNSSEIARTKIFPDHFIEPLVILAKIKGYKGIDDYVIHLIEHELESIIRDGGQGIQDLGEYIIDYIAKIIGPGNEKNEEDEDDKEEKEVDEFVKKVNNDESYNNDNSLKK